MAKKPIEVENERIAKRLAKEAGYGVGAWEIFLPQAYDAWMKGVRKRLQAERARKRRKGK